MNEPVKLPEPERKRSAMAIFGKFVLFLVVGAFALSVLALGTCFLMVNF